MRFPRLALPLFALLCVAEPVRADATLTHRYVFGGNLNDSIGAIHAIDASRGLAIGEPLAYDAARPAGASGPVASVRLGQSGEKVSGFTLPDAALSDAGSLAFWFRADRANAGTGGDYLLNMGGAYNKGLRVAVAAGSDVLEANVANTLTQLGRLSDGGWHQVVVTWDATARTAELYFDGRLAKRRDWTDAGLFTLSAVRVGNWTFSRKYVDNQFTGSLYDFQIYSGRLDASEVKRLHAAPGSVAGPVPSASAR